MYSLLMRGKEGYWDKGVAMWELERYLTHTNDSLMTRMKSMSDEVIHELKSLPTLFAYELPSVDVARVGWITDIQPRKDEVRITFTFDPDIPPIASEQLETMLLELDISAKSELHQTHWAVKEVDLLSVLRKFKVIDPNTSVDSTTFRFSRKTVIRACDLLGKIGHADFDHLLLDIGLIHIDAGRNKGGLKGRSVALSSYVLEHMNERTEEGEILAYAVVRRAAESDSTYCEADESTDPIRADFWTSLKRDGYGFEQGRVSPHTTVDVEIGKMKRPYALTPVRIEEKPMIVIPENPNPLVITGKPKVFIVHGRDSAPKLDVALFLQRIGLQPVILHERPNGGRTLIAKFQQESADIVFAIVLMTPDDVGGLVGEKQQSRARQNVIFELGFFIGKLGAAKVCALMHGDIEKPSDFDAVVYVQYTDSGAWKTELARELKHVGIPFDLDALL